MGLWSFLFGPSEPGEEREAELEGAEALRPTDRPSDPARRTELHRQIAERQRVEEEQEEQPSKHLVGFESTAGRLASRVRRHQLPRWQKVTRKLGKLEERLSEAESTRELRKIAKRALSPERGIFRKIERGMEKRLEDAVPSRRRRYERDLRKLERRLRNPSRFLR